MVATSRNYLLPLYSTGIGHGFDGVVRVAQAGTYGTGTLIQYGRAVLTAAHVLSPSSDEPVQVEFITASGREIVTASSFAIHPLFNDQSNNDIALLWLDEAAPWAADRSSLYRASDEAGQEFVFSGFGVPRTGLGQVDDSPGGTYRLQAQNIFDFEVAAFEDALGFTLSWNPPSGTQLLADFDDGTTAHDAFGRLAGSVDLGLGDIEGVISPGDSGGPAFIQNALAGVASYSFRVFTGSINPDIDSVLNYTFGEMAAWQRVSQYQQWIDQTVRANLPDAPTHPGEVQKSVIEGAAGETKTAYFLVEFQGVRAEAAEFLQVDYATRNGTALAGQDYLEKEGTLVIYSNEDHAVIPVEIIGDDVSEDAETFYLDIFNPVGGAFPGGVESLSAMRTIIDDDFQLA